MCDNEARFDDIYIIFRINHYDSIPDYIDFTVL